ncbi:hypothetical protein RB195_013329 [Necator americanus]|uniref:Uncharacterized protein n=1 Tax=Necator americanus TaxID=51031 RepID=A0ABR1DUZ4_NECAM
MGKRPTRSVIRKIESQPDLMEIIPCRECMYCGLMNHNKALCTLPECIHDQRYELEEIERELETFADYYGPGQ